MWVYNRVLIPYVVVVIDVEPIRERFSTLAPFLDERSRRLLAATEAFAVGYGGITAVAMATGVAPSTIGRGLKELAQDAPSGRIRRPGAGRKPATSKSLPSRKRGSRPCCRILRRWLNRRHVEIQNRRWSLRPRQTSAAARRASNTPNAVTGKACRAAAVAPAVWRVTSRMMTKSASVVPTSSAVM